MVGSFIRQFLTISCPTKSLFSSLEMNIVIRDSLGLFARDRQNRQNPYCLVGSLDVLPSKGFGYYLFTIYKSFFQIKMRLANALWKLLLV